MPLFVYTSLDSPAKRNCRAFLLNSSCDKEIDARIIAAMKSPTLEYADSISLFDQCAFSSIALFAQAGYSVAVFAIAKRSFALVCSRHSAYLRYLFRRFPVCFIFWLSRVRGCYQVARSLTLTSRARFWTAMRDCSLSLTRFRMIIYASSLVPCPPLLALFKLEIPLSRQPARMEKLGRLALSWWTIMRISVFVYTFAKYYIVSHFMRQITARF